MLSRVANNLFWMDRYMERSYGLLNLIKTNYNSTLDSGDYSSWNEVLKIYTGIEKGRDHLEYEDSISTIDFMLFDKTNSNTMINMIIGARQNARSVQEHISRELWLCINKFYLFTTDPKLHQKYKKRDLINFINELIQYNHIYFSLTDISQERGDAYFFMNLGKYFERVVQTIDLLNIRIPKNKDTDTNLIDSYFWKNLISIGGFQLYTKTYKSIFNVDNIMEMVATNEHYPRSIRYTINKLYWQIVSLNKIFHLDDDNQLIFTIGKLNNTLKYSNIDTLKKGGFDKLLERIKSDLNIIYSSINYHYFNQTI